MRRRLCTSAVAHVGTLPVFRIGLSRAAPRSDPASRLRLLFPAGLPSAAATAEALLAAAESEQDVLVSRRTLAQLLEDGGDRLSLIQGETHHHHATLDAPAPSSSSAPSTSSASSPSPSVPTVAHDFALDLRGAQPSSPADDLVAIDDAAPLGTILAAATRDAAPDWDRTAQPTAAIIPNEPPLASATRAMLRAAAEGNVVALEGLLDPLTLNARLPPSGARCACARLRTHDPNPHHPYSPWLPLPFPPCLAPSLTSPLTPLPQIPPAPPNPNPPSALHLAAASGDLTTVRILLSAGSSVDTIAANGSTPLHWAAGGGHSKVLRELLAAGACTEARSSTWCVSVRGEETGQSALHWAAAGGHSDCVDQLVAAAPHTLLSRDERALTPATLAKREGHVRLEALLTKLEQEAVIRVRVRRKQTLVRTITSERRGGQGEPIGAPLPVPG